MVSILSLSFSLDLFVYRGESRVIAFLRAIILVSLCFAIPAFAGYVTVFVPIRAAVMIRTMKVARPWPLSDGIGAFRDLAQENIVMVLVH
jgi:hypothetical protein